MSNTLNQYTAVPSAPPTPVPGYDPDGNATAYPVPAAPTQNATLAWDGENRLITTTVAGTETTAQYDALSRRIAHVQMGSVRACVRNAQQLGLGVNEEGRNSVSMDGG